ncbi:MAG: hypothetical protein LC124_06450 [Ignavibacteriales bacterium]|nr:hypothetical protein [Ignavibacteriales bacterium]
MSEQGQVETTPEGQAEAPEGQVVETPEVIEQIGQLLTPDNQPTETKETSEPENSESETTPEPKKEEPKLEVSKDVIIDEAMVQQYPRLKMFLGKPVLEALPKAYDNVVLAYKKDHEELIKIKQEQAKNSLNSSEVPDSIEKKEEFDKWLAERDDKIRQQAIDEYLSQAKVQTDWVAEARKIVPDGVDFNKFNQEFMMFNAERFYNELGEVRPEVENFYNANPQVLISEMKKYYELTSQANKNKSVIEKEGKDTAYKTITNSLKKAQENKDDQLAQFNAVERSTQVTPEDEILANIYKIAQG